MARKKGNAEDRIPVSTKARESNFLVFRQSHTKGDEVEEEGQCNGENYIGDEERCLRGSFGADISTKSFNLHLRQMGQGGSLYLIALFVSQVWECCSNVTFIALIAMKNAFRGNMNMYFVIEIEDLKSEVRCYPKNNCCPIVCRAIVLLNCLGIGARHRIRTEKCSQSMRFYSVMMVPPAFFYSRLETIRTYAVPWYYKI